MKIRTIILFKHNILLAVYCRVYCRDEVIEMGDIDLNKYEMSWCYELKINGSYQYKVGNLLDWQFTDGLCIINN